MHSTNGGAQHAENAREMRWTTWHAAAWCRSCVPGKGKVDGHFLNMSDDSGVKGVACDCCFMGDAVAVDAMNERCLLVLVHKFYGDRWVTARVVPRKGPEEYAVKAIAEDLQQSGVCRFLCISDGETAIKSLKQHAVQQLRETVGPADVIFEESGAAESQQHVSNGRSGKF